MKEEKIQLKNKEYIVWIGENANDNDEIIKKADPCDIWFHYRDISSPHLILRSNGDKISEKYLKQVARLLFKYKNVPKQSVIYTQVKNVELTETAGSVITKNTRSIKF
jgi:predicted ribosome quality control (RQC) complex YloA/Tae2 family protein